MIRFYPPQPPTISLSVGTAVNPSAEVDLLHSSIDEETAGPRREFPNAATKSRMCPIVPAAFPAARRDPYTAVPRSRRDAEGARTSRRRQ